MITVELWPGVLRTPALQRAPFAGESAHRVVKHRTPTGSLPAFTELPYATRPHSAQFFLYGLLYEAVLYRTALRMFP